jgi:hypothetical protein
VLRQFEQALERVGQPAAASVRRLAAQWGLVAVPR